MRRRPGPAASALALALAGAVFAAPLRARAQSDILTAPGEPSSGHRYRSPQRFAFELKFGPYRPDIDSEFNDLGAANPQPYKNFFGDGRHLLSQIEVDWELWHKFGSLGIGVGAGYFSVTGPAPLGNGTGQLSGDKSTLKVAPFSLSAVYRFDYFLEQRDIPLVPYGKLGLDWAYWQITDGNDEIAHDSLGGTGRGGTTGWHATAGLALVLDFFDPDAAREFDSDLGVNHTAIIAEFTHADISGLGRADRLHLGDSTWALGLLMQF